MDAPCTFAAPGLCGRDRPGMGGTALPAGSAAALAFMVSTEHHALGAAVD
ncbi:MULTISPECIES: hypothetical protein [Actinomycetes]|nr:MULTISPECIES: hypothetical protein [Actinomycetes]